MNEHHITNLHRRDLEDRIRHARFKLGTLDDHEAYTRQVVSLTGKISDRNCSKEDLILIANHYEALAKKVKKKK